ncbi:PRTRC system ParB family protein [Delftia acidovorans CCUG 274B]|uniref:PRTRC system ParB family protein n=1 Tax=Delftia acidovorans TaxID=80866 RepID=UPI0003546A01|nr:PRTRC system ParB family protein [Delftia acidovorans]EPD43256.1 PRTRC system ParB family protein [Delftia acidovorans CCUG 274B]PZP71586.1 MAG: PRTRC system ParB family protein [Delftia acidovorans]
MTDPTHLSQPTLPIQQIVQGKNPREYFDPDEMAELEEGIRAVGVLEPIVVRPVAGTDLYELIAGERRWRAAKNVFGDDYDMPVVIKDASDETAEAMAVIENYHRAAMSPAEEAHAAQRQLLRQRGDKEETARLMGWSPEVLERRLALLACTPAVLKALTTRTIQLGHAELLSGIPPNKQDSVLAGIVAQKVPVAVLKAQLGRYARRLADAVFDTAQCSGCPHNSARQSGLFAESLGEGYCQHPSHFEELTQQAIQARADALRDEYPVIRIVKIGDGFTPLPVSADGDLSVGAPQYTSCQGCHSFGCAVSAMPGSYGEVTRSLCFDAACNSQKVALWRKAQRDAQEALDDAKGKGAAKAGVAKHSGKKPKPVVPTNQTPQRVVSHRVTEWRKWLANALMAQPQCSQRVLIALALAGRGADLREAQFRNAFERLAGQTGGAGFGVRSGLQRAAAAPEAQLERLLQAATASAAFGVNVTDLELLLNYVQVDEGRYFQWNKEFLDLFTMSELESLATEVGLKRAMGSRFKAARAGKKPDFIAALLKVPGFAYQGTVPAVMRYPRQPILADGEEGNETDESERTETIPEQQPEPALA